MAINNGIADASIQQVKREMELRCRDVEVIYIGAGETELSLALAKRNPQLQVLPLNRECEKLSSGVTNKPRLVIIEDDGNEPEKLQPLLAALRDTVPGRLILWSSTLSMSNALSLGFRRLHGIPCLFVFDLSDYKRTPDWFNPDHFAHPDRWGLCVE